MWSNPSPVLLIHYQYERYTPPQCLRMIRGHRKEEGVLWLRF